MGRVDEARETFARFGAVITTEAGFTHAGRGRVDRQCGERSSACRPVGRIVGTSVALTLAALAWGFVNYGVLLWLPTASSPRAAASR